MNEKFKVILDYDSSKMTQTDLIIIDYINSEFVSIIKNNETIESFCHGKPFSIASVHRVAKKLGFNSFIDMKFDLINRYIQRAENTFSNASDIDSNISKLFLPEFDINEYLSFLKVSLANIDWQIIKQMQKDIMSKSTIYVFQEDKIFEVKAFDIYCSLKKIHLVRLTSLQYFEFFKKVQDFEKDSIFLFTKFNVISDIENYFLDFLSSKKIKTYFFTSILQPYRENVFQIVIGNFKRIDNDKKLFIRFKMIYDQLINIIIYSLFNKTHF
ncbi:hypothetical protein [Malacoplasma muris]|uniref:hypothetical protein n=1 Tax=Malacoplasma muris TaxID=2119 RepID=UPI00398ECEC6